MVNTLKITSYRVCYRRLYGKTNSNAKAKIYDDPKDGRTAKT